MRDGDIMRRCVIVGGAEIKEYEKVKEYLRPDDFYIYCDSGLFHTEPLGKAPDLIVGDFDSHEKPDTDVETIVLPSVKDDTDTVFAVKEALKRGFSEFLFVGVTGGRLDHTLGNVYILVMLDELGKKAMIVDDFSEMEIVSGEKAYISEDYPFFSLINIDASPEGITIKDAKYPLEKAGIPCSYQYGVSNEVMPGKRASVEVEKGRILLIRIR